MNQIIEKENINICNMIYEVRGKQVMLDSDLAELYQCSNGTKSINLSVKRNKDRFPEDFCFQITLQELNEILLVKNNSRFQIETLNYNNLKKGKNIKYLPYVFTEQGVAMLASVLRTQVATKVSINIMRTFVELKKYASNNFIEQRYINNQVLKNAEDIKLLQESLNSLSDKTTKDSLFFNGQIYDAYSLLLDIFNESSKCITIIDNYIDKSILDILRRTNKEILIITNKYNNTDYNKYRKQYNNIKLKINNDIHDRFIIIDDKQLYHCGSSLKDLGNKCFAITKIENTKWIEKIKEEVA